MGRVVDLINPVLAGWVKYFRVGNSGKCFIYVKDWVEKKIRRHLMYACKRRGFGWKRSSSASCINLWDCILIKEFDTILPESTASLKGLITLEVKITVEF